MPSQRGQATVIVTGMTLLVTLLVAVLVGQAVVASAAAQPTTERRAEWCHQQDGEVVQINAVWDGGLHCDLPSGDSVSFADLPKNPTTATPTPAPTPVDGHPVNNADLRLMLEHAGHQAAGGS